MTTPFSDGELSLSENVGDLIRRVPVPYGSVRRHSREDAFYSLEAFVHSISPARFHMNTHRTVVGAFGILTTLTVESTMPTSVIHNGFCSLGPLLRRSRRIYRSQLNTENQWFVNNWWGFQELKGGWQPSKSFKGVGRRSKVR